MSYFAYMVECSDGTIYSGYAADVNKRVAVHNSGAGAKYTRSRLPVKLMYFEEFEDKSGAMRREAELKKLSHAAKKALAREMKKTQ